MLAAMKARGLHARLDRQGDPPHLRGSILVKMPIKGRAQFAGMVERAAEDQPIAWRLVWDGNDSKAGRRRYRAAIQTAAYASLVDVLKGGRSHVQHELLLDGEDLGQSTRTAPASPMAAVNRVSVTRGTAITVNTEPFAMDSR